MTRIREHYVEYFYLGFNDGSADWDVLTFSPEPDSEYFYIWTGTVQCNTANQYISINILPDGTNIDLSTVMEIRKPDNPIPYNSATYKYPVGGVGLLQFGSSPPASNTFKISISGATGPSYYFEGKVIIIRKGEYDRFFEQSPLTNVQTVGNIEQDLMSGSFDADFGSDYIKIISFVKNYSEETSTTAFMGHRMEWEGAGVMYSGSNPLNSSNSIPSLYFSNYTYPIFGQQSFVLKHWSNSSGAVTTTSYARVAFIRINYADEYQSDGFPYSDPHSGTTLKKVVETNDFPISDYPYLAFAGSGFGMEYTLWSDIYVRTFGPPGSYFISSETVLDATVSSGFAGAPPYIPEDYSFIHYSNSGNIESGTFGIEYSATTADDVTINSTNTTITVMSLAEIENGSLAAFNTIIQ